MAESPAVVHFTDQADALLDDLVSSCRRARMIEQPGRDEIGDEIFDRVSLMDPNLLTVALMFAAARIDDLEGEVA